MTRNDSYAAAQAAVPSCALTPDGVSEQQRRHRQLAPSVIRTERTADRLIIEFHADYDAQVLDDMLAVERDCCPFFVFDLDRDRRRLQIGVRVPDQMPALDAVAHALTQS